MEISYKWLKEYVDFDLTPQETADALTSCGLEVDALEEVQTIRGGLKGLYVGKVLTCELHPNSDHLHIIQNEPQRIDDLWKVTRYALRRFKEEGFEIGETQSPIIPLYVHDVEKTFVATAKAFEYGVFINPVIPPACAPQDTLVRFALMATHTEEQVERGVQILKRVFRELDIIKD